MIQRNAQRRTKMGTTVHMYNICIIGFAHNRIGTTWSFISCLPCWCCWWWCYWCGCGSNHVDDDSHLDQPDDCLSKYSELAKIGFYCLWLYDSLMSLVERCSSELLSLIPLLPGIMQVSLHLWCGKWLAAFACKVLIASVHFNPQSVEKATSVNQAAFQYSYVVHFEGGICTHGVSKQHSSRGVRILETLKRRGGYFFKHIQVKVDSADDSCSRCSLLSSLFHYIVKHIVLSKIISHNSYKLR